MNTIKKKFGTIIHLHRYFFDNFVIWIGQKNKYIVQNKSVIYLKIYQPTVQYVQWHIAVHNRGSCCSTNGQIIGNKRVQKSHPPFFAQQKL